MSDYNRGLKPFTIEAYGTQVRETYEDRPDFLKYRSVEAVPMEGCQNAQTEVRLYRFGRRDGVREVQGALNGSAVIVQFSPPHRLSKDGAVMTSKWLDAGSGSWNYSVSYKGREKDVIISVHVSLEKGAQIVVEPPTNTETELVLSEDSNDEEERNVDALIDNAVSLIKKKVNHVALKLNPDFSDHSISEIYQDIPNKTLRLCFQNEFGRTIGESFPLYEINKDPRYEPSRHLTMEALKLIVRMEREIKPFSQSVGLGWEAVMP